VSAAPAGNVYDKYGTANPAARSLVARFRGTLDKLLDRARPASILDVGCGEGVLSEAWAARLGVERVVGIDVEDARLRAEWESRARPGLEFSTIEADAALPFGDGEFELVAAIEVLEHAADPERMLTELVRCARSHLLVSVPREPLWRALNVARGAYWRSGGNTPGHRHHWSKRSFQRLVRAHGEVLALRAPLPWTVALVQTAPAAAAISA
jgi:2-polyprenyl-3-methyl-5-hydroxy-6-metoxy-1,4-benzoquinol methylase